MSNQPESISLAEIIGALSLATDLGMGQPLEFALCGCILAVRLGERLGLGDEELREVYYQALLRYKRARSRGAAAVGARRFNRTDRDRADSLPQDRR